MKSASALLGLPLLAGLAVCAAPAMAQQENARVISSTPVMQQVAVPQQVCSQQPVVTTAPRSGAGAVMGAIAGGAMGNAIGNGAGRAAATMIGLVGGAMVGDRVEGSSQQVQNMQTCSTQTTYENRVVGYNVVYEYAGRQYTAQMPNDPGQYINVHVQPVGSQQAAPIQSPITSQTTTTYAQPAVVVSNAAPAVVYAAPPAYYPPAYYAPNYYPPIGVSLGFGYSRGGWGHGPRW